MEWIACCRRLEMQVAEVAGRVVVAIEVTAVASDA